MISFVKSLFLDTFSEIFFQFDFKALLKQLSFFEIAGAVSNFGLSITSKFNQVKLVQICGTLCLSVSSKKWVSKGLQSKLGFFSSLTSNELHFCKESSQSLCKCDFIIITFITITFSAVVVVVVEGDAVIPCFKTPR